MGTTAATTTTTTLTSSTTRPPPLPPSPTLSTRYDADEMGDLKWPRLRRRREAEEGIVDQAKHTLEKAEKDVENILHVPDIAKETGLQTWHIMLIITLILVLVLVLIGWCIWRFCKKKRPKGAAEDGKDEDEKDLVNNEEEQAEEIEE